MCERVWISERKQISLDFCDKPCVWNEDPGSPSNLPDSFLNNYKSSLQIPQYKQTHYKKKIWRGAEKAQN